MKILLLVKQLAFFQDHVQASILLVFMLH